MLSVAVTVAVAVGVAVGVGVGVGVGVAGSALWWPDCFVAISPSRPRFVLLRAGLTAVPHEAAGWTCECTKAA